MRATNHSSWVGRGGVIVAYAFAAWSAFASAALFPRPLHLVVRIDDPITHRATTIDRWCAGNRIIEIRGARVVVTDFDAQTLTEIDRETSTHSITRFDAVARAMPALANAAGTWELLPSTSNARTTARGLEWHSLERDRDRARLDVGIDRSISLSREALDAILGASYPNPRSDVAEAVSRAARGPREGEYALPVEEAMTVENEGDSFTMRTSILAARNESIPDDIARLAAIGRDSTQIESRITRAARELEDLDKLPKKP